MKNEKQNIQVFANEAPGTHEGGNITFNAASNINERYLFGNIEQGKIRLASSSKETPICVITDTATVGDLVNVQIMGSNSSTMKALAAESISAGDTLVADSESKARSLSNMPEGTYAICGIALSNASAGSTVEFTPVLGVEKNN